MNRATKLPAAPSLPAEADPKTAPVIAALKEIMEVREGRRGDPLDRAVTVRDLVEWGLVNENEVSG